MSIRRKQPERGPERLGEILSQLFTARGWGRRQGRLQLERAWAEVAGDRFAPHTRVGQLRRGVLDIQVSSAVLVQELTQFHRRALLEQLRARLPSTPLTDLRFRVAAVNG